MLGINTTADATNKLSVASDAVLFNHNGADSQVKVNKAAASDTASHLFQNNYSGRAEFGLAGDDDFHAKVSPDGSTWNEGILIDKDTGVVTFPSGVGGNCGFNSIVANITTAAPPGAPTAGDTYIVAATAAGDWAGHEGDLALYNGTQWNFLTPVAGWLIFNADDGLFYKYGGSSWGAVAAGAPYEEGDYTPALTFGGTAVGMSGTFEGHYVRIGNFVLAQIRITLTAKGSSTGTAIATLPLAAANGYFPGPVIAVGGMSGLSSIAARPVGATATVQINNQGSWGSTMLDDTNFTDTSNIRLTVPYLM
jgi:hypothetical protein